jgi:hypothetical protein
MSQEEQAAEKAAYTEKFFNCTESPIKEWLADYLNVPVETLFPDYVDEADIIGFPHDNKQYSAYIVTMPCDTECLVDVNLLKSNDKASRACSMLFDAVREVFMAVTGACDNEELKSIMPVFSEEKMAFHLLRVNRKAMQLQAADQQMQQTQKFLQSEDAKNLTPEQYEAVNNGLDHLNKIFLEINKQSLDDEEKICRDVNEHIREKMWMHIVVEEIDPEMADEGMKRLPVFGLPYQDPEEETYIDKLRREAEQ